MDVGVATDPDSLPLEVPCLGADSQIVGRRDDGRLDKRPRRASPALPRSDEKVDNTTSTDKTVSNLSERIATFWSSPSSAWSSQEAPTQQLMVRLPLLPLLMRLREVQAATSSTQISSSSVASVSATPDSQFFDVISTQLHSAVSMHAQCGTVSLRSLIAALQSVLSVADVGWFVLWFVRVFRLVS